MNHLCSLVPRPSCHFISEQGRSGYETICYVQWLHDFQINTIFTQLISHIIWDLLTMLKFL